MSMDEEAALMRRLIEDGRLWRMAFYEGEIHALRSAAVRLGENQQIREGDVKEWLNNRADAILAALGGDA